MRSMSQLVRRYHKSGVLHSNIKVSSDDLSNALKYRVRLDRKDLKQATSSTVDVNVVNTKSSVHLREQQQHSQSHDTITTFLRGNDVIKQVKSLPKHNLPRLAPELLKVLQHRKVHLVLGDQDLQVHSTNVAHLFDKEHHQNQFIPPSKDIKLLDLAIEKGKSYYSSTSSMTSALFQFYKLLNHYVPSNSARFQFLEFSRLMKQLPTSLIMSKQANNTYSIQSDKSADYDTVLSQFGHTAEIMLSGPNINTGDLKVLEQDFQDRLKVIRDEKESKNHKINKDHVKPNSSVLPNVYNYSSYGKFLMRSQLDCYNEGLSGNGTFDLKSRAISHIRYDMGNPDMTNIKYPNKLDVSGEFNDLVRTAAMLKYSFQARIGQMDGIFVAYHNLNEFLGYRYFLLDYIDKIFFKNSKIASFIAEKQFKFSLDILSDLFDQVRKDFPLNDNFRIVMKSTRKWPSKFNVLGVSVVPLTEEQMKTMYAISDTYGKKGGDIEKHKEAVELFNQASASQVSNYSILIENWVNDEKLNLKLLPTSKQDKWILEYRITRKKSDPLEYLKDLSIITGTMVKKRRKSGNPLGETKQPNSGVSDLDMTKIENKSWR